MAIDQHYWVATRKEIIRRYRDPPANWTQEQIEDVGTFFKDFSVTLMLYSRAYVIKTFIALGRHDWLREPTNAAPGLLKYEAFVRAVRKDLGHRDNALGRGDLLRLYVTDVDHSIGPFNPPS